MKNIKVITAAALLLATLSAQAYESRYECSADCIATRDYGNGRIELKTLAVGELTGTSDHSKQEAWDVLTLKCSKLKKTLGAEASAYRVKLIKPESIQIRSAGKTEKFSSTAASTTITGSIFSFGKTTSAKKVSDVKEEHATEISFTPASKKMVDICETNESVKQDPAPTILDGGYLD